ncbi:sulfur carrier protein ThiS [Rhodoligotrophos defluvii]|uniref:sulfur carrier protein ThiS n=1 Tax=Rhodoligotrophos defluvii TaxID=2561934 RepID=UPI0010C965D5|nr:sulfur carrier protein ThiS [Rhodoligotrophos defluvii]
MKLKINGDMHEVASNTLSELLLELGYGDIVVATAVNQAFVPATARHNVTLAPGDSVEVLAPMQGG